MPNNKYCRNSSLLSVDYLKKKAIAVDAAQIPGTIYGMCIVNVTENNRAPSLHKF